MTVLRQTITARSARAIAEALEREVAEGSIARGARLPSVRRLAAELEVSPATAAAAYQELRTRGVIIARERQGMYVAPQPPLPTSLWDPVDPNLRDLASGSPDPALLPDLPALEPQRPPRLYGEETNLPALCELAAEQFASDGIAHAPIAVVSGAMDGVERALTAHLRPGDAVAVEDPGYTAVLDLVRALGLEPLPVRMDPLGMLPDALVEALARHARAAVLTPRAQNPTGAAPDPERAAELTAILADHPGVLVIEDDHAGPVAGVPHRSVVGDREHWVVVRSVAKSLGPDLRLAVLTGDAQTVARIEGRQQLGPGWVSHILQRMVVALWRDPKVTEVLDTAARAYRDRAGALVAALAEHEIPATGRSGLTVWIPVSEELAVVRGLERAGWAVRPGERYRLRSGPGIRVTSACLPEEEAGTFAADLAAVIANKAPSHTRSA